MSVATRIRLGTRASALARWQADWVAGELTARGVEVDLVPISTQGDREQAGPIGTFGSTGVFTKELQRALLDRQIDLAVHSLKDLPTAAVPGLCLAAVPERAPCGDVLLAREPTTLDRLVPGAVIGTGSFRRRAQLAHRRPDLRMADIRGNVDTRLRKLDQGDYDALVLAEAGLRRLGLEGRITQKLFPDVLLPAIGQGALGLETRTDDAPTRDALAALDHGPTHTAVLAERAMLLALEGGCLAPIAAWGRIESGRLTLTGRVLDAAGTRQLESTLAGDPAAPLDLGNQVAATLLAQGAAELIGAARQSK